MSIRKRSVWVLTMCISVGSLSLAEESRPDPSAFLLNESREIALARSAAPSSISEAATILVLRAKGYEKVSEGSNGFVCLVLRSWGNPDFDPRYLNDPGIIVPECLDRHAAATILPLQLFRAELGLKGTPAEQSRELVSQGFASGRFQRVDSVAFSYMMSAAMSVQPHVMVYLPDHYTNETMGGLSYGDKLTFVEGGPDGPYVAAMIMQPGRGIEPEL